MDPAEAEGFKPPSDIDWPTGIDDELEQRIRQEVIKGKKPHEIVLGIMDEQKNKVNRSLPPALDNYSTCEIEIIDYNNVIQRMKGAFEIQDPKFRQGKVSSALRIDQRLNKQLPEAVNFQEDLTELQHDLKLVEEDPSGIALADALVRQNSQPGIIKAVQRYKELHDFTAGLKQ